MACVDWGVAQWRVPCAFAHDGQRLAHSGVVGAKNDQSPRQIQPAIDRAGNVSGVHIPGVGNDAPQGADLRFGFPRGIGTRRGVGLNFGPEMLRIGGIEASCDGWLTYCGSHDARSFLCCGGSVKSFG